MSWLLWGTIPLITFAASASEGGGPTVILPLVLALGDLAIFGLSFFVRQSYWRTTRLDLACGALSIAAVGLWIVTRSGNIAIVLSIVADFLACAPTLVKAYREPESEHALTYALSGLGAFLTALTITDWTLANAAFAVYLFGIDVLIVVFILVVHRRPTPGGHNPDPVDTSA